VAEHNANPRMLIIHEVMGRSCGWLTAYTAKVYHENLEELDFLPHIGLSSERKDVHAIFVPEMEIDIAAEAARLGKVMDEVDNVNIFISEGAGLEAIIKEMEATGEEVPRDAFGHAKLDAVNPGVWFGKQFAKLLGAEKVLIQKSGYFARAAASNKADRDLIKMCADKAIESAMEGVGGVIGHDEDQNFELRAIEFPRIAGGKPFDIDTDWFGELLADIGQANGGKVVAKH
jgi:pyrophosphate--fructose-6-phosphate 1-phosphotransferase